MSEHNHAEPAAIRARLKHPVIDSDGHWVEYHPVLLDYLKKVGGTKAVEGMKSRDEIVGRILALSDEQRRDEGRAQQSWWPFPTKNTRDRATAMIPRLLYERMGELGLDFTVLYPTSGLGLYAIGDDEMRQATCDRGAGIRSQDNRTQGVRVRERDTAADPGAGAEGRADPHGGDLRHARTRQPIRL